MSKIYISFAKIQKYLTTYYLKDKKTASLFDAVYALYSKKKYSYIPKQKINVDPQLSKEEQLVELLQHILIDVTPIVKNASPLQKNVTENYFMFHERDARMMLQFQNESTNIHTHNYFEIDLVLRGTATVSCMNDKFELSQDSFIIISPNTQHQVEVDKDSLIICIAIKKSTFDETFFNILRGNNFLANFFNQNLYSSSHNYLNFSLALNSEIMEVLYQIAVSSYSTLPYANEICCNYISILFSYLLRDLTDFNKNVESKATSTKMISVINQIKFNYQTITLKSLAEKFNYDQAYLGKLIKTNTGYSFNYLRNHYRIQKSCSILRYTDYNIAKISQMIGYNSPNHFERCFHNFMKISPKKYRQKFLN